MKHTYFIFSDVDGTLFSHEQCGIPEKSLLAIKKARENGHKFFISSGRGKHMIDYNDYKFEKYVVKQGDIIVTSKSSKVKFAVVDEVLKDKNSILYKDYNKFKKTYYDNQEYYNG